MEWSKDFLAGYYQSYGPIFDIFSAIIEQATGNISDRESFELKHLLTFVELSGKTKIKSREVNLKTNSKEIKTIEPKARVY